MIPCVYGISFGKEVLVGSRARLSCLASSGRLEHPVKQ